MVRKKNGFIASLIAVAFMSLMVLLWTTIQQASLFFEKDLVEAVPLAFSGYVFENVFQELNLIAGPGINISTNNLSIIITTGQTLPVASINATLATYDTLLPGNYSPRIHANLSTNYTNITDGSIDLIVLGEYRYRTNNSGSTNYVLFHRFNQSTSVTRYDINISASLTRQAVTNFVWDGNGDINVSLTYSDNNGTVTSTGFLRNNVVNTFSIRYAGNQTTNITIGTVGVQAGALLLADDAGTTYSLASWLPLNMSKRLSVAYEATLNYTQGMIGKIGLVQRG